jgi:hypothetical protein
VKRHQLSSRVPQNTPQNSRIASAAPCSKRSVARNPLIDFRTFVASGEVDLPVDVLQVRRTSVLQRMSSFSQAFEREYGRKAKKIKPKKNVPTLKVGIGVFTRQRK